MDEDQAKELGRFLRRHREGAGLSTRDVAAKVGVDMAQIVRIENGRRIAPRADLLGAIAETVGAPLADVLTMAGYPTTRALPNLRPYMRAKYRNLPSEAVDEIEAFVDELTRKHGNSGPSAGEDEN